MFVAAAVCPHPPLLIPAVASGAAAELADLRAACRAAIEVLLDARPERLLVTGAGADVRGQGLGGSMRRFGVDLHVGNVADASLPPSLTVGAWLLAEAGCRLPVEYVGCGAAAPAQRCAAAVRETVAGEPRVGLLAMADLSAKLSTGSPGYLDARAAGFDRGVVDALTRGDADGLGRLDPDLAEELWCSDVPVLASLAAAARTADGAAITATVHYDGAPYGVGYVVASWRVG